MSDIRERIARALWDRQQEVTSRKYPGFIIWRWDEIYEGQRALFRDFADAVIAALGLREVHDGEGHYWQTPWERIEDDA